MCSLSSLSAIVGGRKGRDAMCVSPDGTDYEIVRKWKMRGKLPLARTSSGHIMLPISVYRSHYMQLTDQTIENEEDDSEWKVVTSEETDDQTSY